MIEWEAERCKINYERLSKMHSKVDLCGQRVLSFTAAKQRANAIDHLVAPWPISPLMGWPSNFNHKGYQRLFMVYDYDI
jgi:hypothetical protein